MEHKDLREWLALTERSSGLAKTLWNKALEIHLLRAYSAAQISILASTTTASSRYWHADIDLHGRTFGRRCSSLTTKPWHIPLLRSWLRTAFPVDEAVDLSQNNRDDSVSSELRLPVRLTLS